MPIVTIQQGPRDIELKRELVKRVTDAFVDAYKIPAETVQVWIHEVPTDSWGAMRHAHRRQVGRDRRWPPRRTGHRRRRRLASHGPSVRTADRHAPPSQLVASSR